MPAASASCEGLEEFLVAIEDGYRSVVPRTSNGPRAYSRARALRDGHGCPRVAACDAGEFAAPPGVGVDEWSPPHTSEIRVETIVESTLSAVERPLTIIESMLAVVESQRTIVERRLSIVRSQRTIVDTILTVAESQLTIVALATRHHAAVLRTAYQAAAGGATRVRPSAWFHDPTNGSG